SIWHVYHGLEEVGIGFNVGKFEMSLAVNFVALHVKGCLCTSEAAQLLVLVNQEVENFRFIDIRLDPVNLELGFLFLGDENIDIRVVSDHLLQFLTTLFSAALYCNPITTDAMSVSQANSFILKFL